MSQTPSQVPVQAPQGQVSVQEQERQARERREYERQQREIERQRQEANGSAKSREAFERRQELLQEEKRQQRQTGPRAAQVRVYQQRQKEHLEAFLQRQELAGEQRNIQRGSGFAKVPQQKVVWQSQVPTYVPVPDEYTLVPDEKAIAASVVFYTNLGFPQFGGRYAPFEYPLGAWFGKPLSIVETSEGLEITFKPYTTSVAKKQVFVPLSRWSELKDFGQDIANVKANAGTSSLSREIIRFQNQVPVLPQRIRDLYGMGPPPSGFVMAGYAVAAFERLYNPYAPSIVEGLTSGKQALIGTLMGEAALMLVGGKVASWTVEGTYNPLKWKGSRPESWAIKHSDWYAERATKGMAPEIVSTPSMMIQEPISMAKLKAGEKLGEYSSYFWGETPIPKAAEVWLAKAPSASSGLKTWVAETWIKRITGGTAFTLIQEEISQTIKPELPFIPAAQLLKSSSFLPSITGASALLGLGLIPRAATVSKPMLVSLPKLSQISRPKIESLSSLKLGNIVGNVPASVTKAFSVVSAGTKLASVQASVQEAKQVQSQAQVQRQIQRLTGQFKTPSLTKATSFEFPSEEPTKKRKKRGRKALMLEMGIGEFYYPEPPTLEQIFGKPSKRRRKK